MKKIGVFIIPLLFFWPVSVHALTLHEAIRTAKEHNLAIQMSREKIMREQARLKAASRYFQENPVLSWDYTAKEDSTNSYTIGLGQTFEVRGQRKDRMVMARKSIEEARYNVKELWLHLKNNIIQTYIDNWAVEQKIALYEKALKQEKSLQNYVRLRVAGGEDSPDILSVAAMDLAHIKKVVWNLRTNKCILKSRLSLLLGGRVIAAIDTSFKRDFSLPSFPVLKRSLRNNPGLKAMEAKIEKAKAFCALTKKMAPSPVCRQDCAREVTQERKRLRHPCPFPSLFLIPRALKLQQHLTKCGRTGMQSMHR